MNDLLKNISLFSGLKPAELGAISKFAVKKAYPRLTVIISEGDETNSLYIIHSGSVKVTLRSEEGKEVILSILRAGDFFGELAIIDDEPRSACVTTMEPSEFYIISRAGFKRCISEHPGIATNLLKQMSRRLRNTNEKIGSLALMDVYGRVARILLQFAKPKDGRLVITEKLTHKDIAEMAGASRETVSRIFKDLTEMNCITLAEEGLVINDKAPFRK